jgi:hypothetical protein
MRVAPKTALRDKNLALSSGSAIDLSDYFVYLKIIRPSASLLRLDSARPMTLKGGHLRETK